MNLRHLQRIVAHVRRRQQIIKIRYLIAAEDTIRELNVCLTNRYLKGGPILEDFVKFIN